MSFKEQRFVFKTRPTELKAKGRSKYLLYEQQMIDEARASHTGPDVVKLRIGSKASTHQFFREMMV